MSFSCAADRETLQLSRGRSLAKGQGQEQVGYRAGSATFEGGALTEFRSEEASQETFWYR